MMNMRNRALYDGAEPAYFATMGRDDFDSWAKASRFRAKSAAWFGFWAQCQCGQWYSEPDACAAVRGYAGEIEQTCCPDCWETGVFDPIL